MPEAETEQVGDTRTETQRPETSISSACRQPTKLLLGIGPGRSSIAAVGRRQHTGLLTDAAGHASPLRTLLCSPPPQPPSSCDSYRGCALQSSRGRVQRDGRRRGGAALRRLRPLFVQYSPGNIRLMKCDTCRAVADPYIECEFMIILIDLILHKTRAYRHLLFNKLHIGSSVDKGILCQFMLMHIVLDAFRISVSRSNKADGDSSRSTLSTICNCSEVLGEALLGNIIFMAMLLLGVRYILRFSFEITRYRQILLAIIISSYFKLFLLTMMVWEFPSSAIIIVEIFVLSSNVVALRVVTWFPKAHCVGVCFAAHAAKHLIERWLIRTP